MKSDYSRFVYEECQNTKQKTVPTFCSLTIVNSLSCHPNCLSSGPKIKTETVNDRDHGVRSVNGRDQAKSR